MNKPDLFTNEQIKAEWKRWRKRSRAVIGSNPFTAAFAKELKKNLGAGFKLRMKLRAQ